MNCIILGGTFSLARWLFLLNNFNLPIHCLSELMTKCLLMLLWILIISGNYVFGGLGFLAHDSE